MDDLVGFLHRHPPFDTLTTAELERLAAAGRLVDAEPGQLVWDGFAAPADVLWVVLDGEVELWDDSGTLVEGPDEVLAPGGVFGFSALLTRDAIGPRAIAQGPARLLRLPGSVVAPVFSSSAGVRFLVRNLAAPSNRPGPVPAYSTVDQLVVSPPVIGDPGMTVADAARLMTAHGSRYAVIPLGDGSAAPAPYGLVTDALLRERVLAAGRPADTPVVEVVTTPATTVSETLAADALIELTERGLDYLVVTDRAGGVRGVVVPDDFVVSPSAAGVPLREQVTRAGSAAELISLGRRVPPLVRDMLHRGRTAAEITAVRSTITDAVQRRALSLVLERHPDLREDEITWLALGSNGRREPVLSSDVDSAAVLADSVDTPARVAAYRRAFAEVDGLLGRVGLHVDEHHATPGAASFARTREQWRRAARRWLADPLSGQALIMTSLLLDARPILGDPGLPVVVEVFGDIRSHPRTFVLMLQESLARRARLRTMRDVLVRRGGTFDIKTHALAPVVDMARCAALSVRSAELSTRARLAAAAGSPILDPDQAHTLIEVFEVLQRIRLSYQLAQLERGDPATDVLSMHRLSPLDRSLIAQAVREVAAIQRRVANLAQLLDPEEWVRSPHPA
ncbi:putative nucleotidyltransferase substrate binding domain-containing protein [Nakamurella endophytica]|uniref:putative nucleotidyltransferase substrate binding domain-containing protein n=1 Tax=Nakamurella endophytica TaxID=1748367 RepID=UPI001E4D71C3|nr:putative nucleotidyltransferase substrate binding domain-containing protein [Nakamurella endophytica]